MAFDKAEKFNHLFLSKHKSDVSFVCPKKLHEIHVVSSGNTCIGDEIKYGVEEYRQDDPRNTVAEFPAHIFVLCRQSEVFQAMFYGPLANNVDTVCIKDMEPEIVKELLRFIYCNKARLNGDNVFQCVYAAKKYDVIGLIQECVAFLTENICIANACSIYEQALFFDLTLLKWNCLQFMLENGSEIFQTKAFLEICHETLLELLESDDLIAEEVEIFEACVCWSKYHCRKYGKEITPQNLRSDLDLAIYKIRFPTMCKDDFYDIVMPTKILTGEEETEICEYLDSPFLTPVDMFVNRERS